MTVRSWSDRNILVISVLIASVAVAAVAGQLFVVRGGPTALGAPHFVDETASSGIDHTYAGDFTYAVGGGVAAFDCNGDGKPSLYLAGGSNTAALYRNDSAIGGALHFTRLRSPATDIAGVMGAYPIDVDSDGNADLVVLESSGAALLRGLGGCRFERANERWGYDGGTAVTTAFSATWERGATLPTLAFGAYVDPKSDDPHHLCFDNTLVRPATAGATYARPVPLRPSWCALSMLFSDWDRSGHMDLRVSNDAQYYLPTDGEEQLWRMRPGETPTLYTADDGWVRVQINGMGIASYDLQGTGFPDVFLTSQADNRLQTLAAGAAKPTYRDIGLRRGVNSAQPFTGGDTRPSTAWHAEFADVNNDSLVDLFVAKGNVTAQPEYAEKDPSDLFLGQSDGTFRQGADAAGIVSFDRGRGAALVDLNLSGLLDLVQVSYGAPVRVWRNVGAGTAGEPRAMGNWLGISLAQRAPNVDAVGAWIEVRAGDRVMRRELTVGGGHAGGQLGWTHFGLGGATGADVRVLWPDGARGGWTSVGANSFYVLDRDAPSARKWSANGD